jgi:hypothetical protein
MFSMNLLGVVIARTAETLLTLFEICWEVSSVCNAIIQPATSTEVDAQAIVEPIDGIVETG